MYKSGKDVGAFVGVRCDVAGFIEISGCTCGCIYCGNFVIGGFDDSHVMSEDIDAGVAIYSVASAGDGGTSRAGVGTTTFGDGARASEREYFFSVTFHLGEVGS